VLQKQPININFSKGLDTKSDPWQVPIENFIELENSIFNTNGRLQKRDGFSVIGTINDSTVNQITNYNDDIIAVGNSLYAFNQQNGSFVNKGAFYPTNVSTLSCLANGFDTFYADAAKSSNGLICTVYQQLNTGFGTFYGYTIQNATTGQTIINPTALDPNGGTLFGPGKVFFLNNRFVIIFSVNNGANYSLKYITIDQSTLNVTSAVSISTDYSPIIPATGHMKWDAIVANNRIFVGYNHTTSGFYVGAIDSSFNVITPIQANTVQADIVGCCTNGTNAYFGNYQNSTGDGQITGLTESGGTISVLSGFPQRWILTTFTGNTVASTSTIDTITNTDDIFPGIQLDTTSVGTPFTTTVAMQPYERPTVNTITNTTTVQANVTWLSNQAGVTFTFYKVKNIAMEVIGTTITILAEVENVYPFVTTIESPVEAPTNLIFKRTCTTAGVVSATKTILKRGLGLWSKAFQLDGTIYFVGTYSFGSTRTQNLTYQPGYYVIDSDGNIIARLAYLFGVGYAGVGLVNTTIDFFSGTTTNGSAVVTGISSTNNLQVGQRVISTSTPVTDTYIASIDSASQITLTRNATASGSTTFFSNQIWFSYLNQGSQELTAVGLGRETSAGLVPIINNYSNNTARACKLELLYEKTGFSEIGTSLSLTGGYLWNYDGVLATENNFFVFPDTVTIKALSTSGNLAVGTYQYAATYEWTDNKGNINRSATQPVTFTIKPASNFTGDTTISTNTITNVTNIADLQVGQRFSGGSFSPGVFIVFIDVATSTITVSGLAGATAAAVAFTMSDSERVRSVNVVVPTLRLTNKPNVTINIYRWFEGNQTFYLTSDVRQPLSNNTLVDYLVYTDDLSFDSLTGSAILYCNADAQIQNNSLGPCKSLTIFDNRQWLVDSENPNNIYYSKQVIQGTPIEMNSLFTLYISPTQSSQGTTGPVECLFPMDDKLIIFKKNSIYYLNGIGPDNSGANSQYSEPILITSTVGCANQKSIVFMQDGLMFQSNKGIWLLGRDLSTSYIGANVERIAENYIVTSAHLVPGTNEVRLALNNGKTLMYDYFYKQWSEFVGMPNLSSIITNDLQTYLNNNGQIRRQTRGAFLDDTSPILIKFKTAWFSLAGIQGFQRAYFMFLLAKYVSNHTLNVSIAYDFNSYDSQSVVISPVNFASGITDLSDVEKWRIMITNQKCESMQVTLQEAQSGPGYDEGLEISGLNVVVGLKKGYRTQNQFTTIG